MKPVKEFTPEEVRDFILLCLRTQWTSLGHANTMERDLNAAIARQKSEREEKEKADLPFPRRGDNGPPNCWGGGEMVNPNDTAALDKLGVDLAAALKAAAKEEVG